VIFGGLATQTDITESRCEMGKLRPGIAQFHAAIASPRIAQWINGAVRANILTVTGAMIAIWQIAAHH